MFIVLFDIRNYNLVMFLLIYVEFINEHAILTYTNNTSLFSEIDFN